MDENTVRRLLAAVGLFAAAAHVVAPRTLLATARWGYGTVLKVDFEPTDASTRRVRLLGAPALLLSAYLWWSAEDST